MRRRNSHCVWAGRSGAATLGVSLALLLLLAACARGQPAAGGSAPPKPGAEPAAGQPAADPRAVADFYRGKTVRVIVGFGAGGGFDTYSRLIARHLGRFIPGNPTVIVENMPGAGSLVAANHLFNVAQKDGTVIGNFHGNLVMQQALGAEGVRFDAARFPYLGVPAVDNILCVAHQRTGFKTLRDAQNPGGRQIVLGGAAPGSTTDDVAEVLKEALDLNLRLVPGYDTTAKMRLAMEQGEIDGLCGWSWESIKTSNYEQIASGEYVVLVQATERPLAELPQQAPLAYDLARTPEARELIRIGIVNLGRHTRPYALPPGVPADRVAALRAAFQDTVRDPQFLDDAQKAKLDVDVTSAEETEQLIRELLGMPEGLKTRLKTVLLPR